jgi:hypothetical protein
MTYWNQPQVCKVYEALTAIADNLIELVAENTARCYSSSRGKFYEINYDPTTDSIMSNDNSAFYTDSLSYPMIALLMLKGRIAYDQSLLPVLANIAWKDINQKFKNDYDKAVDYVLNDLATSGVDIENLQTKVAEIHQQVCQLQLKPLGEKVKPPAAY